MENVGVVQCHPTAAVWSFMNRYKLHEPMTRTYPLKVGDRVKFTQKYIDDPTWDRGDPTARGTITYGVIVSRGEQGIVKWTVKWDVETGLGNDVPAEILEHE